MFLSIEKGIFFHILSYIFAVECQIPVIYCLEALVTNVDTKAGYQPVIGHG